MAKEVVLRRDAQVAVWQWPAHRVLWSKAIQQGQRLAVVAQEESGPMVCHIGGDHYCVLWPGDIQSAEATEHSSSDRKA